MKNVLVSCLLFLFPGYLLSQKVNVDNIKKHIAYLASDELKGRGTGTDDEKKAADYIVKQFKEAGLSPIGVKPLEKTYIKPFTFKKGKSLHDTSTAGQPVKSGNNVVGFIDNRAEITVVIGGHYDHLGMGHDHNSLEEKPEGKVHNGADDNASGTAGVIELARYFANNNFSEPFNILFICFSGEELGLYGSKKYLENSDVHLSRINYMINMDMIGRLNDENKLVIYGVGTSPIWVPLIDSLKSDKLSIKKDSAGIGPSDHASFYLKDIPVLAFFTGQHADYHKPTDDADKINYAGEVKVLEYVINVIEKTYHYPKLGFLKTRNPDTGKANIKVTMGVMPDYTFEGKGMKIDGVTDGKPAAKAGLAKGDVVTKVGADEVTDVMSYMKALNKYKKGDKVDVEVLRGTEKKVLNVEF